ncbi:MAG: glutathione-dependent disulfide-bond oxidoreductase [Novosphingobium sp.]|jgi:GST-like protein|nr:glutathione-dependent disulfide-bond oxidoreductase [Novosphingobium sp.]
MAEDYLPPEVWTWDAASAKGFRLNRPIAGATHEQELPRGQHPFQLYSLGSPNGQKATIMFEELLAAGFTGAEYDAWMIDIMAGDQFGSGFVSVNPNSKIPALLDLSGPEPVRVFESGAILLHLAERFGAFIPGDAGGRAECLSWLFWQMSNAPSMGGGFGHFYRMAPVKIEYAINRYAMEVKRIVDVADRRLGESRYFAGDTYTIADIANFTWLHYFHTSNAYGGATKFLDIPSYRNVDRWVCEVRARIPVQRGLRVNLTAAGTTRERHSAADIDAAMAESP